MGPGRNPNRRRSSPLNTGTILQESVRYWETAFRFEPLTSAARILILAALVRGSKRKAVSQYLTDSWRIVPVLRGEDLRRLGFRPGPIYREILAALRSARLDGQLHTRPDGVSFRPRRVPGPSLQGRQVIEKWAWITAELLSESMSLRAR